MTSLAVPPSGVGTIRRRRLWVIAGGLAFGALAGYLGTSGSATHILMLAVVLLPVMLWRRPYLAPAVLMGAAVLVEQGAPGPRIPITGKIPMFQGIGPGHLQGADMLLLLVLFIYLMKRGQWGTLWLPRTHVSLAIRGVLACVALSVMIGQAHGGNLRVALMEARPYVYLATTYFLTAVFIRERRAIRAVLWAFVGSVAFKSVQGIYVWVENRHMYPKPESYITHEASYFFVIYMMLVLALWLFGQRDSMRTWATRLLPLVMFANTVNDRRAAWEMLGGALLCFGVIAYKALPIRRHLLGKTIVGLVLVSAVYFPVMWNSSSSLGVPARAIKSQIAPSTRDADSDTYRVQENANLELNIKQDGLLGKGFGVKIDYALPITDISQTDPLIAYIPHNDVLDVLMRMGLLGGVAMWFLIASGIILGSRLAMSKDREVAVIGMLLACSIVAYALMGAVDQGFFFFRIAFITGSLLGLAEAARRLARVESTLVGKSPPATIPVMPSHRDSRQAVITVVGEPASHRPAGVCAARGRRAGGGRGGARRSATQTGLELLSLIHRLPGTEEQAILDLIERWDWTRRFDGPGASSGNGSDTGTEFAPRSTQLRAGFEQRIVLPGDGFRSRANAGLGAVRGGRVASPLLDVVARDRIGYLLAAERSEGPAKLSPAATLAQRRLLEAAVADLPDLRRLADPAVRRAELAWIRRAHDMQLLRAFVGYGPGG